MAIVLIIALVILNGFTGIAIGMYWATERGYGLTYKDLILATIPIVNTVYILSK